MYLSIYFLTFFPASERRFLAAGSLIPSVRAISAVDIPYLTRNTQINLATVMNLAQAPARPAKARIANAGELENHTVIVWEPVRKADGSVDTDLAYEILCRETDLPEWHVLDTVAPDPSLLMPVFRCPLSKDNYFFAVRSLSPAGNPSLPVLAL